LLALWMLRIFLPALAWALVVAVATWPLYRRFVLLLSGHGHGHHHYRRTLAAAIFTLLIGLILVLPLGIAAIRLGHEAFVLANRAAANAANGLTAPEWIARLPFVGSYIADWWAANLAQPGAARDFLHHLNDGFILVWARALGTELLHRLLLFFFTLLTLFFLFRDGAALARQLSALADRLFGDRGRLLGNHLIAAVRATVNGLVLVGLGEGVAWGIACAVAGLPRPTLIGAVSGLLAIIPFGLPISIFVCAAVVLAEGHMISAAALVAYGMLVVFIADHVIRPALISGAARLPFLWVLLGLLGGLETFGLIGLFLGPAVLAALMTLWREWAAPTSAAEP
jgi:predicted PurR-regulated permease PerM